MNRRVFLSSAGLAAVPALVGCSGSRAPQRNSVDQGPKLAEKTLPELRARYWSDLFDSVLPFWEQHGVDKEYGGVLCFLDYDGTRVNTDKFLWFQGRAIWIYSYLYNNFGDRKHLEIASNIKQFVYDNARGADGWWAELLSREGKVLRPFSGDVYGMYFVVEGLQEYAAAAGDEGAMQTAVDLFLKLNTFIEQPDFHHPGTPSPGVRPQGFWMVNLRIATQILQRIEHPEIESIAERSVEAIVEKHFNPDIGLNNEHLHYDFSRVEGEERKCLFGHSIENYWMVMDEALRIDDQALWDVCADRIHRHLEIGWDHVFGGLMHMVNVDAGGYTWPPDRPVGTDYDFRFIGEYHYMKAMWALTEVLIATLNVYERRQLEWASRFFGLAQAAIDEKFSMASEGLAGYVLFGDRQVTRHPSVARQDNYHPPRQLMLNIQSLDRMLTLS